MEKNVVNTITILNKQISSIVASFLNETEQGKIMMITESTHSIFGYTNSEY